MLAHAYADAHMHGAPHARTRTTANAAKTCTCWRVQTKTNHTYPQPLLLHVQMICGIQQPCLPYLRLAGITCALEAWALCVTSSDMHTKASPTGSTVGLKHTQFGSSSGSSHKTPTPAAQPQLRPDGTARLRPGAGGARQGTQPGCALHLKP